jgi:phage shock protein C
MKRLYRSREDRMVAGICAGLAEYLDADPTIVRIVTALAILFTGFPALAYFAAWILIPEKPQDISNY